MGVMVSKFIFLGVSNFEGSRCGQEGGCTRQDGREDIQEGMVWMPEIVVEGILGSLGLTVVGMEEGSGAQT